MLECLTILFDRLFYRLRENQFPLPIVQKSERHEENSDRGAACYPKCEVRAKRAAFWITFRSMRCLAVVKFATEELTTAKYGCSDQRERNRILRVICCCPLGIFSEREGNLGTFIRRNYLCERHKCADQASQIHLRMTCIVAKSSKNLMAR